MSKAAPANLPLHEGILREPVPETSRVLWLPGDCDGTFQYWDRISERGRMVPEGLEAERAGFARADESARVGSTQPAQRAGIDGLQAPVGRDAGPGILRLAGSAAQSIARFIAGRLQTVAAATRRRRLDTCGCCPQHTGLRCKVCGCFTGIKSRLAHEECPLGKWPG